MSRSLFFQLDHETFCSLAKVGPHNVMFNDMIRGQCDELLCSVQKKKKEKEKRAIKDGAYYCYCAYVLRISRYSDFLWPMLTNTGIFLRGLKLSGESRS